MQHHTGFGLKPQSYKSSLFWTLGRQNLPTGQQVLSMWTVRPKGLMGQRLTHIFQSQGRHIYSRARRFKSSFQRLASTNEVEGSSLSALEASKAEFLISFYAFKASAHTFHASL
jgi:hypothetical protein